jgi:hypothetical protein
LILLWKNPLSASAEKTSRWQPILKGAQSAGLLWSEFRPQVAIKRQIGGCEVDRYASPLFILTGHGEVLARGTHRVHNHELSKALCRAHQAAIATGGNIPYYLPRIQRIVTRGNHRQSGKDISWGPISATPKPNIVQRAVIPTG